MMTVQDLEQVERIVRSALRWIDKTTPVGDGQGQARALPLLAQELSPWQQDISGLGNRRQNPTGSGFYLGGIKVTRPAYESKAVQG